MTRPIKNLPVGDPPACACGCGAETAWNRRKNRWNKYVEGHYRQDAPYKHADWLREQYVHKNRTVADIAQESGVSLFGIIRYMKRFDIERRSPSAAHIGRQVGENNPAWRGGVAQWDYASGWKVLARQIRNRDHWICQDCGEQRKRWGNYLHVHHIDENKLNNDPANLVSLCAACHMKRHGGRPRCTEPDCDDAINARGLCSIHYQRRKRAGTLPD